MFDLTRAKHDLDATFPTLEHPLSDLALQALAFLQEISRDVPPSIIVCNAAISACEKGETAWEPTPLG